MRLLLHAHADVLDRLMSDYEVNLVNDNMQEFYVRFYGPAESACLTSRIIYLPC